MFSKTLVIAALALVLASEAAAGCFATLGMSLPRGIDAGERWNVRLQVMQHGVRPVPNAQPTVTIVNGTTGERRTFKGRALKKAGDYAATVVFPSRGRWHLSGNDGFNDPGGAWRCSQKHTFGLASIGVPPPSAPPSAPPPSTPESAPVAAASEENGRTGLWIGLGAGGLALGALAAAALLARPRGRVAGA